MCATKYFFYQICNLTLESSHKIDFILKSIPIVVINEDVKESSEYLNSKHDLPTPTNK